MTFSAENETVAVPAPRIRLRVCTEADIPELSELVLNICDRDNDPADFSVEGREAFRRRASPQGMSGRSKDPRLHVIRYGAYLGEDPALVGMAEMFVDVESEEQGAWKIMYIFVDGRRHHRGIGTKLMERCLANASPGARVKLRSAPAAIPFYEKFGFQVCGPPTTPKGNGIRGSPLTLRVPKT